MKFDYAISVLGDDIQLLKQNYTRNLSTTYTPIDIYTNNKITELEQAIELLKENDNGK